MRLTALLVVALCLLSAGAWARSGAKVEAQASMATAKTLLAAHHLDEALVAVNRAVELAPEWPDPYYLRAQIELEKAGPDSTLVELGSPAPGHDYSVMAGTLGAAADDVERFIKLNPELLGRAQMLELAGDLRARQLAAESAAKVMAQRQAEDAARQQAVLDRQRAEEAERQRLQAEAQRQADERARAEQERQKREHEAAEAKKKQDAIAAREALRADLGSRRTQGYVIAGGGAVAAVGAGIFLGLGAAQASSIRKGGFATGSAIDGAGNVGVGANVGAVACGVLAIAGLAYGLPVWLSNVDPGPLDARVEPGQ